MGAKSGRPRIPADVERQVLTESGHCCAVCGEPLPLDDHQRLGQVSIYMTEYFRMMNDLDRAVESGQRALTLATSLGDVGLQVRANFYMGAVYYDLGNYCQALNCLRWNVASLEGALMRERFGMTGLPSVLSRVS